MTSAFDEMLNQTRQGLIKIGIGDADVKQSVSGAVDGDFRTRALSAHTSIVANETPTSATGGTLSGTVNGIPFDFRPKEVS